MSHQMSHRGFTIVELIIVIAIIATLTMISVPAMMSARINSNESAAIATMQLIAQSQHPFNTACHVDQNSNGTGEFGTLAELTGYANLRGKTTTVNPVPLTKALIPISTTYASKQNYNFKMYLPSGAYNTTGFTDNGTATIQVIVNYATVPTDAALLDAQEIKWRAYGWPATAGSTGIRAFAIDQLTEVYGCPNKNGSAYRWNGASGPGFNAALPTGDDTLFAKDITPGVTSLSTEVWKSCK